MRKTVDLLKLYDRTCFSRLYENCSSELDAYKGKLFNIHHLYQIMVRVFKCSYQYEISDKISDTLHHAKKLVEDIFYRNNDQDENETSETLKAKVQVRIRLYVNCIIFSEIQKQL